MLSQKIKSYIIVTLSILFSMIIGGFCLLLPNTTTKKAQAASTFLTVQKVLLQDAYSTDDLNVSEHRHNPSQITNVNEGDFVILDTELKDYQLEDGIYSGREAIFINFPNVSAIGSVTIKYNGQAIKQNEISRDEQNNQYDSFSQYLHVLTPEEVTSSNLHDSYNTYLNSGNKVTFPEGKYEIIVTYINDRDAIDTFSFYALTQKTYSTPNINPTFNDTEKFTLQNQEHSTLHYFNFNNKNTTYFDAQDNSIKPTQTKNTSILYYPTISYDPEHYELSFTRTLYNYRETTSILFTNTNGTNGIVNINTITSTGLSNSRQYAITLNQTTNRFLITVQFDQVGEYIISKTPKLKINTSPATYITPANDIITSNTELLKTERLVINGFTAQYANTTTTQAPLYNDTYSIATTEGATIENTRSNIIYYHDFLTPSNELIPVSNGSTIKPETIYTSDFTFLNLDKINNPDSLKYTSINPNTVMQDFVYSNSNYEIASTNLAPVMFEYYGKLETGNSTETYSWYAYTNNAGITTVSKYTRGLQFQNAGTYLVSIAYENVIYNANNSGSMGNSIGFQIFAFQITNTTPQVKIYAQDSNTSPTLLSSQSASILNMDDFTNKYVYASWQAGGPFDAQISATYSIIDWNGNVIKQDQELTGLIYQKGKTSNYTIQANPTLLFGQNKTINNIAGIDGYYIIKISKNNSQTFVNYTFSIDTTPITGIKALTIANNQLSEFSELNENAPNKFNLTTNQSFGWTWDDKLSNSPITAKYIYASISTLSNFNLYDLVNVTDLKVKANEGAVLMPTNAQLNSFSSAVDYTKIPSIDTDITSLKSSQIISTPQLAILLLTDTAGNTSIFITILDNTETKVLQDPKQSTYVNIITSDTNFYWGTHKSISAVDESSVQNEIIDIYDFVNNDYTFLFKNTQFTASSIIKNALNEMNISQNQSLVFPINSASFAHGDNQNPDANITPSVSNSKAHNWFATVKVIENAENYNTQIWVDGQNSSSHPAHILVEGEFIYSLYITDFINNSSKLDILVNLDKSQGSLYSYNTFVTADGSSLEYLRENGNTTNRQYVANTFSTNRNFITFSWTEPADEYFKIEEIKLEFYPFSYDTNDTNQDQTLSYPFSSDTSASQTTYLYQAGQDTSSLFKIDYNGVIYYQTNVLKKLTLDSYFNGPASEAGKYVITRTYTDNFDNLSSTEQAGDVKVKTYTYFVDRNQIIPTKTSQYGDDLHLSFGYDTYPGYNEYGNITYNDFSFVNNSDTFADISFNYTNPSAKVPSNTLISSNVLPVGINFKLWQDTNGNLVYDKYYKSEFNSIENLQNLFYTLRNFSRVQVAVQYFALTPTGNYSISQTFYSSTASEDAEFGGTKSLPLNKLQKAFTGIGKYRVVLFDLSNFQGYLSGNPYVDFASLSYNVTGGGSLAPNSTIFNFEITGIAPNFNYQTSQSGSEYVNISNNVTITNDDQIRITWSEPSNIYSAKIAFNDVVVTRQIYTKDNPKTNPDGTQNPGLLQTVHTFKNPIVLTCDLADKAKFESDPNYVAFTSIENYNSNSNNNLTTYIYKETEAELLAIINKLYNFQDFASYEFYKIKQNGIYNYYLLLPQAYFENETLYQDKLADAEFSATVHYIGNETDYTYNNSDIYYKTTKTVYVDNTAPYQNLTKLIQEDVFINSINENFADFLTQNIDNIDVTFLKSYAFAVSPGFTLDYINEYETDTYFHYFKRDNYTGKKNEQTVTEGQPGYEEATHKFSIGVSGYKTGVYNNGPNQNLTVTTFNEIGYYDIIEQDKSGNLRVYTIFVTDNEYAINGQANNSIYLLNSNDTQTYLNGTPTQNPTINSKDYRISSINTLDKWSIITLSNQMGTETLNICYAPKSDNITNITYEFDQNLVEFNTRYHLTNDLNEIIDLINNFIQQTASAHASEFGTQIILTLQNRLNSTNNLQITVNTEGLTLLTSEEDFLNLITLNSQNNTFAIKLPNTTNILSTKLTAFNVYVNGIKQNSDSEAYILPTTLSEFENDKSINSGYIFNLANNITYRFEFIDNFNRKITYSYPIDSSLVKYLQFTNATTQYEFNSTNYTYTSGDVKFVYQANGLRVKLTIYDFDTSSIVYTNLSGSDVNDLDTNSPYYTYTQETILSNLITLTFKANLNIHYYVKIEVDNYTDTATVYDFVIYTHFPNIVLTDSSGSPLLNTITSKQVIINWEEIDALFSPRVELTHPSGHVEEITSGTLVSEKGTYTIKLYNSIGEYLNSQITFTIQEYAVSVYGVYQITSGTSTQLIAHTSNYKYYFDNVATPIPHYLFLSSESNWDKNIQIICNENKGLSFEVVAEYGQGNTTRIYKVFGTTSHVLTMYFAVTRIPPILNIATYTNFRVDGNTTNTTSTIKTNATTLTWETTYTDTTATPNGTFDNVYKQFFALELRYNGTLVGVYTSGKITLTNPGIYDIRIIDAVGQTQYFGSNASSTQYTINLLTNVIYYINDELAIPYAIYSDDVDLFVPNLSYYDAKPEVSILRNNSSFTITPTSDGHYIFTQPGIYQVSMRCTIQNILGTDAADLIANYQFQIISPNEALQNFIFSPLTGYHIISVVQSNIDITDQIKGNQEKISSILIDKDNFGVGKYEITVQKNGQGYIPDQTFTFNFWINDETINITPSREWGSNSTAGFNLTVNTGSVYEKIGECFIQVNGQTILTIDETNGTNIEPTTTQNFTQSGSYVIQLVSASGNILQSHRITIDVPLNTAAIILIVVAVIVVITLVITFIVMRNRVKVR